jgi:exopolysaccharide production protein ExoQ
MGINWYYMGAMVLGSEGFGSLIKGGSASAGGATSSPIFTVLWGAIYAISFYRVIQRRREALKLLRANKALVFMVGLICASFFWSIERSITLHGAATLVFTTFFAIDFSLRFSIKRQLELAAKAMAFLLIASVIAEVVFPGVVPVEASESATAWHGVFEFKNNFGRMICLGTVALLASSRKSTLLRVFIFLCGLGLAILSKAVSFAGYTVLLCAVLAGWSILKWRPKPRLVGILAIAIAGGLSIGYISANIVKVTAMLDKDPHMTGRVDLWEWSYVYIQKKPMLGYGAGAFWGPDSQPARRIREAVKWDEAPHAHDAYIDTALSLGWVGLAAYFLLYGVVFRRAYRYFMAGPEDYRRWPLTYLVFVLIYQFTESGILGGGSILWMLFAGMTFSLTYEEQASKAHLPEHVQVAPAREAAYI